MNAVFELVAGRIDMGHFESSCGNVGRMDFGLGEFFGESHCDTARSRADVYDANWAGRGRPASVVFLNHFQDGFNYVLSFWTGNEYCGSDDEVHAPEFLVAGNVLCGHSAGALLERFLIAGLFFSREFALGMSE